MFVLIWLPKICLLRELQLRRTPCFIGLSEQVFDRGHAVLSPPTVTSCAHIYMQQQDDEEEDDELVDLNLPPFVSSGTAPRPPNPVATTLTAGRRLRRRKAASSDDILRQAAARWAEAEAEAEAPAETGAEAAAAAEAESEKWLVGKIARKRPPVTSPDY